MELYNSLPLEIQHKIIDDYKLVYRNGIYLSKLDTSSFEDLYRNVPKIRYSHYSNPSFQIKIKGTNKMIGCAYFSDIGWLMMVLKQF